MDDHQYFIVIIILTIVFGASHTVSSSIAAVDGKFWIKQSFFQNHIIVYLQNVHATGLGTIAQSPALWSFANVYAGRMPNGTYSDYYLTTIHI